MNKKFAIAALIFLAPATSFADNVGGCGVGAKLFNGQSGLAPNVSAVITDGYLDASWSVRPFAMTSGTSGCTQDGAIKSTWKTAMFIDGNKDRLARDMSDRQRRDAGFARPPDRRARGRPRDVRPPHAGERVGHLPLGQHHR